AKRRAAVGVHAECAAPDRRLSGAAFQRADGLAALRDRASATGSGAEGLARSRLAAHRPLGARTAVPERVASAILASEEVLRKRALEHQQLQFCPQAALRRKAACL